MCGRVIQASPPDLLAFKSVKRHGPEGTAITKFIGDKPTKAGIICLYARGRRPCQVFGLLSFARPGCGSLS
jgi:hypothetical protein